MSKPVFIASQVEYHDNSREYNIDARGRDLAAVLRACEAHDITPVPEEQNNPAAITRLPFLVIEKLNEIGTYSLAEFTELYHENVRSGAPQLAKFLKHYQQLNVFDLAGYNKRATYDKLKAFFGDEMDYGYPNFAAYY